MIEYCYEMINRLYLLKLKKEDKNEILLYESELKELKKIINLFFGSKNLSTKQKNIIAMSMTEITRLAYKNVVDKNKINIKGSINIDEILLFMDNVDNENFTEALMTRDNTFATCFSENKKLVDEVVETSTLEGNKIINLAIKRIGFIKNRLEEIEIKYRPERNNFIKKVIGEIVATTLSLAIICSISFNTNDKDKNNDMPKDEIVSYLEENNYDELISYYEEGLITNINNIDLYIYFSKKYDLEMSTIISVVDEVINSYINSDEKEITEEEVKENITRKLNKLV